MHASNKTVGLLRFFAFAAALVATSLVSGCVASDGEEIADDDDGDATEDGPVAATEQELASCRHHGVNGSIYSFGGGRFRVCWIKHNGPYGARVSEYYLRNASGRTRRLKIALDNIPDTHCQTVRNGAQYVFQVDGYRFAGKPQAVKAC